MKTRNVNLDNTPLLTNNVCKYIYLDAPTETELIKKVKEYEILLARALTNKYKLTYLSLGNNGKYVSLPSGNYHANILLEFSGFAKPEIKNPEKTLQIIKHLTAMESEKNEKHHTITRSLNRRRLKSCTETENIVFNVKQGTTVDEAISSKQYQILETLISKINLKHIFFFICKNPTPSIKVTYKYDKEIKENENENQNER